jgi:DNA-damage-inducible protein J
MNNVTVQSRVSPTLKKQADAMFADMGMSIADAIRIFLYQAVNDGGLPFQPHGKSPNTKTLQTFADTDAGKGLTRHGNIDDIFAKLGA